MILSVGIIIVFYELYVNSLTYIVNVFCSVSTKPYFGAPVSQQSLLASLSCSVFFVFFCCYSFRLPASYSSYIRLSNHPQTTLKQKYYYYQYQSSTVNYFNFRNDALRSVNFRSTARRYVPFLCHYVPLICGITFYIFAALHSIFCRYFSSHIGTFNSVSFHFVP